MAKVRCAHAASKADSSSQGVSHDRVHRTVLKSEVLTLERPSFTPFVESDACTSRHPSRHQLPRQHFPRPTREEHLYPEPLFVIFLNLPLSIPQHHLTPSSPPNFFYPSRVVIPSYTGHQTCSA